MSISENRVINKEKGHSRTSWSAGHQVDLIKSSIYGQYNRDSEHALHCLHSSVYVHPSLVQLPQNNIQKKICQSVDVDLDSCW